MSLQDKVEKNTGLLIVLTLLAVSVGGMVEILPLFKMKSMTEPIEGLKPYNAMQLAGRDIYIREGCVSCHSQMIRPFRSETERYGHYSVAGEFVYDRPFLWGSKRTGPDLARVGGRYSDTWLREHMITPRELVPGSVMPSYPWLETNMLDTSTISKKMIALRKLGHPYSDDEINSAPAQLDGKTELDALVAYLQSLGTHIKERR